MTHERIPVFISEEHKIQLREHLTEQNYAGGWDDWLYDRFKDICIGSQGTIVSGKVSTLQGMTFKITKKDIEKLSVRFKKSFKGEGTRTMFTFGPKMYQGLLNSWKIQEFVDNKLKSPKKSFEEFIDNAVKVNLNTILLKTYTSDLDDELAVLKKGKDETDKDKSKKKTKKR